MRIVMAASIFPPEIGGPAPYAAALKDSLEKLGHTVEVRVFSRLKKYPSGIRHLIYLFSLLRAAHHADALIAFDVLTVGLPAAIVRAVMGIPTVARIGGDFIWERYVERIGDLIPLPIFYTQRQKWSGKDAFLFRIVRFVLSNVTVAFTSEWQRDIWKEAYGEIPNSRILENAFPGREENRAPLKKNFLFFGRQIKLKNAAAFKRAFARAKERFPDISLEEGMVPQSELHQKMADCYAWVLPSISDVTPNTILDAVRFGKPFLLTKYSAYAEQFKDCGVIVDPLDEKDMQKGIETLLDTQVYARMSANTQHFNAARTYDDIAREFIQALKNV